MAKGRNAKAKPSHQSLGRAIQDRRKEIGITQADLSEKTSVHISYLSGLENGKRNPTWTVLTLISLAIDLPLSELVQRAEQG